MQKLFDFITSYKHWLLLLLIEAVAISLFLSDGLYRQMLKLYAQSYISGSISEVMMQAHSYMKLREQNEALLRSKALIEQEVVMLKRQVGELEAQGRHPLGDSLQQVSDFVTARIINIIGEQADVYYMINRGESSGIKPDMAVVSATGIVGAIAETSKHYSIVIPMLNPKHRISSRVKGKPYQGHISGQGVGRPILFGGTPLHANISVGDTILTSGYSYIYPEGIMLGTVTQAESNQAKETTSAFGSYTLKPSTDFDHLSYVYVRLSQSPIEAKILQDSLLAPQP